MSFSADRAKPGFRGFTLIELLVVVAIIAILAAILFPVFARAKQSAKRAACLANLRQLGVAIRMYQSDFNGGFPSYSPYPDPPDWQFCRWVPMLLPYTKSRKFFDCPGAQNPIVRGTPSTRIGYSMNEFIYFRDWTFKTENSIPRPRYTLLMADGCYNPLTPDWVDGGWDPCRNLPAPYNIPSGMARIKYADGNIGGKNVERHGGSNVLFCDLHCASIKPMDYKAVNWPGTDHRTTCREWPIIWPTAKPYLQ